MRSALIPLMVLFSVLDGGGLCAQDDAPWWRQLFGQEEADEVPVTAEEQVQEAMEEAVEPFGSDAAGQTSADADGLDADDGSTWQAGSVHLDIPLEIKELDSLNTAADEVVIPGYRVQLFMGPLDTARALRHGLRNGALSGSEVHLVPYPPSFGVQVGDFRTPLAAYRVKRSLEAQFPDALVVPAGLRPQDAFPAPQGCVRTP